MKIGKFANINRLSVDSIRHYMDLGLILPDKQGGQYDFDERCQQDLDDIMNLKGMGFTLNEIGTIFKFKRLGKLTSYEQDGYFKRLFITKYESLLEEIEVLNTYKTKVGQKIEELSHKEQGKAFVMGVSLQALQALGCIKCGANLVIVDGSISNHQIIDGKLGCPCGEEYAIESGIVKVSGRDNIVEYQGEYEQYIGEYIHATDASYLDNMNRGLEWVYKKINFDDFKGKVILELGSGIGFFLRYIYKDLPDDCLYIAVDHSNKRHQFLKCILEKTGIKKNILFLCTDFLQIPLKHRSADIVIDHSGTSNYSFYNEGFLLALIDHHVKEEARLLGAYILFKNFSKRSLIGEQYRPNFLLENVKKSIGELGYQAIDENITETIDKSSKYENYFVEGERVYGYIYYGKR